MSNHIRSLEEFASIHQMVINTKKTHMVLFNPMKSIDVSPLGFKINGEEIGSVEEFKLLGLMLSSNMSWNAHIDYIIKRANSRIWTINRMKNRGVSNEILIRMYRLRVRSLLEYLAPVFTGALSQNHKVRIERVQKKYFRCIFGKDIFKNKSYSEVCKLLCMETLEQRRIMLCITFVKRSLKQHPDLFPTAHHSKETRFSHLNLVSKLSKTLSSQTLQFTSEKEIP